jgi:O-antigen ligase
MMAAAIKNSWFHFLAFTVLLVSVSFFAYTGNFLALAVPPAFLYIVLLCVNWKLAYWIFIFSIPASIQLSFASDTAVLTLPDEPLMWLFLILFALLIARNPKILPEWWWKDGLVLVVTLEFIWLIVAVVFSKVLFFSVKFLLAKTWLLVCFFILPFWIFNEKKDYIRAFFVLLVPMFATIIVILIHHYLLGFKFDKVQKSMSGLYYNHVDYSTVISMFFPLLLVAVPLSKKKSWLTKAILYSIIVIFLVAIGFAYARAAVVGVVFAIVVGIAVHKKWANAVMPVFYGLIILLFCYVIPNNKYLDFRPDYNNTYMHKNFTDHMIATFRGKDMSSMERLYRWIAAIRMSKDRLWTGYGPHGFYYYYKPYAVTMFQTYVSRNVEHSTTHNYFLYMLVEQGLPAMILYAILIPLIFSKAQRLYHACQDRFYKLTVLGLVMVVAVGFINNFFSELIESHKVACLFYIPLAMLIIIDRKIKTGEMS